MLRRWLLFPKYSHHGHPNPEEQIGSSDSFHADVDSGSTFHVNSCHRALRFVFRAITKTRLRTRNILPHLLRESPPQQLQCSSSVSLLPSWLSVGSFITSRFNRCSLTGHGFSCCLHFGRNFWQGRCFQTRCSRPGTRNPGL